MKKVLPLLTVAIILTASCFGASKYQGGGYFPSSNGFQYDDKDIYLINQNLFANENIGVYFAVDFNKDTTAHPNYQDFYDYVMMNAAASPDMADPEARVIHMLYYTPENKADIILSDTIKDVLTQTEIDEIKGYLQQENVDVPTKVNNAAAALFAKLYEGKDYERSAEVEAILDRYRALNPDYEKKTGTVWTWVGVSSAIVIIAAVAVVTKKKKK